MRKQNFRNLDVSNEEIEAYSSADPFPHAVIDNFLSESCFTELVAEFPSVSDTTWHKFGSGQEYNKRNSTDLKLKRLMSIIQFLSFAQMNPEDTRPRIL